MTTYKQAWTDIASPIRVYKLRLAVYGNMKIDSGMIGIASTSTPDYWIPMIVNMNFTKPKRANHSKIFSLQETN